MSSPIPTDFKFINMSTGRNKNNDADQRKCTIEYILETESPTLVFVEEFTWAGLHEGSAFSEFDIPINYKFVGNWNAGFIYDSRYIDCERLDLKSSVRRSYGESIAEHSDEINFDLPRLCICKIKSIGPPEFELLGVSWHGPKNHYNKEKQKEHLRSLLRFLLKIKVECGNLPLMLGGDFNLKSSDVKDVCKKISGKLKKIRSKNKDSIMLWIQSDDFTQTFEYLDIAEKPYDAFDHDVLILNLQISTTVEILKREIQLHGKLVKETLVNDPWYNLRIYETKEDINLLSVSWHGDDPDISDDAKRESSYKAKKKSVILLLHSLQKLVRSNAQESLSIEVDLKFLLRDEPTRENIHSKNNTLDTWILSNDKEFLDENKQDNQTLEDIEFNQPPAENQDVGDIHLDLVNYSQPGSKYTLRGYIKGSST